MWLGVKEGGLRVTLVATPWDQGRVSQLVELGKLVGALALSGHTSPGPWALLSPPPSAAKGPHISLHVPSLLPPHPPFPDEQILCSGKVFISVT